jgi:hypothetical protein
MRNLAMQKTRTADGCNGSKCENLAVSKSFPLYPSNRTLLKTIASADSGQQRP